MKMINITKKLLRTDSGNVAINVLAGFLLKGAGMMIAFFTTSAYITYFSNDAVLGVWFTLLSILAWILNFDMGIGNGIRNKLVKTFVENDDEESRRYISSAYIMLFAIATVTLVIGSISIAFIPWMKVLGISSEMMDWQVLLSGIRIVFCSIIVQFVLRLITSITFALQRSYVSSVLNLATNVILLGYVFFANNTGNRGNFVTLAKVYFAAVNLPLVVVTVWVFCTRLRCMVPNIHYFSMYHAKGTLKLGGVFLYLQLVAMLLNNSANFLISSLLGAEQVVEYQLYYRIFSLMSTIVAIAIVPMWSAITKALVEKRYKWLRRAISLMFLLVGLIAIGEFLIVPCLPVIFKIWLGENVRRVNYTTGFAFAIFGSMFTWQQICCYISNGLGKLKIQAISLTIGLVISIAFSVLFANLWGNYLAITIGSILGYVPSCIVQTMWTISYCRSLGKE